MTAHTITDSELAETMLTLEWNPGFSLFFVFEKTQNKSQSLEISICKHQSKNNNKLRSIRPSSIEDLNSRYLPQIFEKPAPLWLDLTVIYSIDGGPSICAKLISTLNKRRSQIEKEIKSPFFIVLPVSAAQHIVTWAPDLWTIREKIIEID